LAIRFSSVLLKLTGPAQYLGKKNLLAFDFTHMQLSVLIVPHSGEFRGGKEKEMNFYDQPIAKLLFAFFLVTEDFIAARGRGGGLARLRRLEHFQVHLRQNTNFILFKLQALLRLLARHRFERVNGFDATMTQKTVLTILPVLPSVWILLPLQSLRAIAQSQPLLLLETVILLNN